MLLLLPILLILGLFLPGYFIAKSLRQSLSWAAALPISLLVLFHGIFWLGILHLPLTLRTMLPFVLAVSALSGWLAKRSDWTVRKVSIPMPSKWDRLLILSCGLVGAVLLARSAISPLIGGDTRFRWDFLAQRILELGRFDFYPPLTPADFRTYFFVDGIPPLVSFTHWWMYASAGSYLPVLICLFVAAQFACTLAFTYGAASALFSPRAGILAAAMLAACPLFFRSVVAGTETGITALSIAAMIYFIVAARQENHLPAMVSAGLCAALCALAREYGWIALIAGLIALVWRKQPRKHVMVFAAVAIVAAAPWYARNWVLSGNPFYSLTFAGFPVNPIHTGIMQQYQASLGFQNWTALTWESSAWFLLAFAPIQIFAGIPGGFVQFRRYGYLIAIAFLLLVVWLQSVGYTSGGVALSTRVLSPWAVVLSITGAALLERRACGERWYTVIAGTILLFQLWTAAHGALYPVNPASVPLGEWAGKAFRDVPPEAEFQVSDRLAKMLPAGSRILSDNAFLYVALGSKGIEVVPVWSPEVSFIFSASPEESERRLAALRISSVAYYPRSLNTRYLASASPFYAALPRRWHIHAQVPGMFYIVGPEKP